MRRLGVDIGREIMTGTTAGAGAGASDSGSDSGGGEVKEGLVIFGVM